MVTKRVYEVLKQCYSDIAQWQDACIAKWTSHPFMKEVFATYNMEAEYFEAHYASEIFDCVIEAAAGNRSPRGCIGVHTLIDYLKNRYVTSEDFNRVFIAFRQSVFAVLIEKQCMRPELFDEMQHLLDEQFDGATFYFNTTLVAKELSIRDGLQRFKEYQKAIDKSAIVSKTDTRGMITYVNKAFMDVSGYSEDELIGEPHNIIRHPDMDPAVFKALWDTISSKRIFHGIIKNRKKNGDAYYVDSTIVPILDEDNDIIEYIAMRHDITELIDALARAEEAQKAKESFLSNMSHEIRTPLNAIMGFVTILNKRITDEKSRHYLGIINNSGHTLLNIINDILDFSKIQSGKFTIDPHGFDPIQELSSVTMLFASKAYEKQLEYFVYIDPHLPECLYADSGRIKQVVANLLSNAIKFTPDKGSVKVKVTYEAQQLVVMVQDSGIGIPPDKQEKIFNAFEQADGSTTRTHGGTGLGLSISSELSRLMEGSLSLKSVPEKGSVFTLEVPAGICEQNNRIPLNSELLETLKIAVVQEEQKDPMRSLFVRYLKDFGVEAVSYRSDVANVPTDIVVCSASSSAVQELIHTKQPAIVLMKRPSNIYAVYPHLYTLTAPLVPFEVLRVLEEATSKHLYDALDMNHHDNLCFEGHVLIAEDNKNNQTLMSMMLEEFGLTYTVVSDGAAAVKRFREETFDLVLMDVNMPKLGGIEAMHQIKAYEKESGRAPVPVVAVTASVMENERNHILSEGMDDFIPKPVQSQKLVEVLRTYLESKACDSGVDTAERI